jgi:hypothetical protein
MKKTLLLAAALACSGVVAQEKEIWACQQEVGTGLFWEGGTWRQKGIIPTPLLLTIDGKNSSYKEGDREVAVDCSEKDILLASVISCLDNFSSEHIFMDKDTGRMGMSALYGVRSSSSEYRDSVAARIFNCTKF